jgi:hypothetical protein
MSNRGIWYVATTALVLSFTAILPSNAGDALELSASYTVPEVREGVDTVSMTFSFVLRAGSGKDVTVDRVILADPGKADPSFATFDGGTIPAGGELKRSSGVVVPASEFKRWKDSAATLFVYTRDDRGDTIRNRVDAYRRAGSQ